MRTVELLSRSTGVGLPASHLFFSFRLVCEPETFFWAERAQIVHKPIDRRMDVQIVTASIADWRRILAAGSEDELIHAQLETIKRVINVDKTGNAEDNLTKEHLLRIDKKGR